MIDSITHAVEVTRLQSLLELLIVFVPLTIFGIIGNRIGGDKVGGVGIIYLGYVVSILLATYILHHNGTGWQQIGLARPANWSHTLLAALGVIVVAIIVTIVVQTVAINLLGAGEIDQSRFNPLAGNLPLLLGSIIAAWTIIAFGEEMLWRAFLVTWLGDIFGQTRIGVVMSVVIASVAFGLAHYVEGPVGIVNTAAFGLVLATAYLETNLWVTIIPHGLLNTVRFAMLYFAVQG